MFGCTILGVWVSSVPWVFKCIYLMGKGGGGGGGAHKGGTKTAHCDNPFLVHHEIKYTRKV